MEGQMVVDFVKRMEMAVVNTYFKKTEEHRVTCKSGVRCTEVKYVLCRRCSLKEIGDFKVVTGENVAMQRCMVVCRMNLETEKRKRMRAESRIEWWKFREELKQALGGSEQLPDGWVTTADVVRETARNLLVLSSGQRKDKENRWWNEKVQGMEMEMCGLARRVC